jgi:hypothetical protein
MDPFFPILTGLLPTQAQSPQIAQIPQAGRELAQRQIAEVQYLGPGPPSLLDPPLRLPQVFLHDAWILANPPGGGCRLPAHSRLIRATLPASGGSASRHNSKWSRRSVNSADSRPAKE